MKNSEKETISQSLGKLEKIIGWFDEQTDVHVEEGLKRVREGALLIKGLRGRLKEVENEFHEIKKDLETDDSS